MDARGPTQRIDVHVRAAVEGGHAGRDRVGGNTGFVETTNPFPHSEILQALPSTPTFRCYPRKGKEGVKNPERVSILPQGLEWTWSGTI